MSADSPGKETEGSPGKETEEEVTGWDYLLLPVEREVLLEKHFLSPFQRVTNWPNRVRNHLINVQEVFWLSADGGSFLLFASSE
jgi:hypothetical protein